MQLLFAVPCITTTIWLGNGYDRYLSWAWTILPMIPLVCYLADASTDDKLEEAVIPLNLIALGVVSFLAENYYGIATAISYAIDHYLVLKQGQQYDIPAQDLYNYGLCFFAFFALRAIGYWCFWYIYIWPIFITVRFENCISLLSCTYIFLYDVSCYYCLLYCIWRNYMLNKDVKQNFSLFSYLTVRPPQKISARFERRLPTPWKYPWKCRK